MGASAPRDNLKQRRAEIVCLGWQGPLLLIALMSSGQPQPPSITTLTEDRSDTEPALVPLLGPLQQLVWSKHHCLPGSPLGVRFCKA